MLIEQVLIFSLGFLVATLLGLMVVPALSRRAMRLARRRIELQLPLSPAEILAERDQLRAEYAVKQRQTEQKFESAQVSQAEITGELGRRTSQLVQLENQHTATRKTLDETQAELDKTASELKDLQAQTSSNALALYDEGERHSALQGQFARLRQTHADLTDHADELSAVLVGLDAQKAGLELEVADLHRKLNEAQHRIELAKSENELLLSEQHLARYEAENSSRLREKLNEALGTARAKIQSQRDQITTAEAKIAAQAHELAELASTLTTEQTTRAEMDSRHAATTQDHAAAAKSWQQQVQNLKSEVAALEGALTASRQRKPAKSEPAPAADIEALRTAISEIAAQVVRQSGENGSLPNLLSDLAAQTKPRPKSKPKSLADRILEG